MFTSPIIEARFRHHKVDGHAMPFATADFPLVQAIQRELTSPDAGTCTGANKVAAVLKLSTGTVFFVFVSGQYHNVHRTRYNAVSSNRLF